MNFWYCYLPGFYPPKNATFATFKYIVCTCKPVYLDIWIPVWQPWIMLVIEVIMILHEKVHNPSKFRSEYSRSRNDMKSHFFKPHLFAAKMQIPQIYLYLYSLFHKTFWGHKHFKLCKDTVISLKFYWTKNIDVWNCFAEFFFILKLRKLQL